MLASTVVLSLAVADGNGKNTGWKGKSGTAGAMRSNAAETGLIGIHLYDDGLRIIQKFGSPDEIQALGGGTSNSIGPSGGAGRGPGAVGSDGGRGGANGGGRGGGTQSVGTDINKGIDWGSTEFFLQGRGGPPQAGGLNEGGPQPQGVSGAGGGGQAGGGGIGGGGGATGTDARILFTRWVYKRGNSRFGFILDKFNHIIQIEAIGSADSRVYTNRGIRYGSQVKDIITRYGAPDAYEINGDQIVMRYLIKNKVAFRLNRLKTDKPHVVTGIVVAAGKA
jgi:hypothetical protein